MGAGTASSTALSLAPSFSSFSRFGCLSSLAFLLFALPLLLLLFFPLFLALPIPLPHFLFLFHPSLSPLFLRPRPTPARKASLKATVHDAARRSATLPWERETRELGVRRWKRRETRCHQICLRRNRVRGRACPPEGVVAGLEEWPLHQQFCRSRLVQRVLETCDDPCSVLSP